MKQKLKIPALRDLELYKVSEVFKRVVELVEYYCLEDLAMETLRKSRPGLLTIIGSFIMVAMGSLLFVKSDYRGDHPLLILGMLLLSILGILRDSVRVEKRKLQIQEKRLAISHHLNSFITLNDLLFFQKTIYENEKLEENASDVVRKFFKAAGKILNLEERDSKCDFTKQLRSSLHLDAQE